MPSLARPFASDLQCDEEKSSPHDNTIVEQTEQSNTTDMTFTSSTAELLFPDADTDPFKQNIKAAFEGMKLGDLSAEQVANGRRDANAEERALGKRFAKNRLELDEVVTRIYQNANAVFDILKAEVAEHQAPVPEQSDDLTAILTDSVDVLHEEFQALFSLVLESQTTTSAHIQQHKRVLIEQHTLLLQEQMLGLRAGHQAWLKQRLVGEGEAEHDLAVLSVGHSVMAQTKQKLSRLTLQSGLLRQRISELSQACGQQDAETRNLRAQITQLLAVNLQMRTKNADLSSQLDQLQEQTAELSTAKLHAESESADLRNPLTRVCKKGETMTGEPVKPSTEYQRMEQENAHFRKQVKQMYEEREVLRVKLAQTEQEREALRIQATHFQISKAQIDALKQRSTELASQSERVAEEYANELKDKAAELGRAESQVMNLQTEFDAEKAAHLLTKDAASSRLSRNATIEHWREKIDKQIDARKMADEECVRLRSQLADTHERLKSTSSTVSCSRCRLLEQRQRGLQQKLDSWVNRITAAEVLHNAAKQQADAAKLRADALHEELEEETNHKQTLESQAMQMKQWIKSLLAENKTLQEGAVTTRRASSATQANDAETKVKESGLQHIPEETLTERPQTPPSADEIEQLKARVAELESEVEELMIMAKDANDQLQERDDEATIMCSHHASAQHPVRPLDDSWYDIGDGKAFRSQLDEVDDKKAEYWEHRYNALLARMASMQGVQL